PGACRPPGRTSPTTRPASGDGCCPPGANGVCDNDCPAACGNGLVEWPREFCDKALPAGSPGACPTDCPALPPGCNKARLVGDADSCTRRCTVETIGECKHDDGCCPASCRMDNDH